jgi:dihydrodipicolinate synthase/N-acetylneuraminate lyase
MFDDLNKTIKEGQERWKKIEELTDEINKQNYYQGMKTLVELVTLIVDHMRPMNPSQEQLDEATSGLADLLKTLKK